MSGAWCTVYGVSLWGPQGYIYVSTHRFTTFIAANWMHLKLVQLGASLMWVVRRCSLAVPKEIVYVVWYPVYGIRGRNTSQSVSRKEGSTECIKSRLHSSSRVDCLFQCSESGLEQRQRAGPGGVAQCRLTWHCPAEMPVSSLDSGV